jgi:hypothetical protein
MSAEWRRTRLDALPPGVPSDYCGELCQRIDVCGPWVCDCRIREVVYRRIQKLFDGYDGP